MKRTHVLLATILTLASLTALTGCGRDPRKVEMPADVSTGTVAPVEAGVPARIDERAEDAVGAVNGITEAEQSAVDALGQ